jgi:hypothetical protein
MALFKNLFGGGKKDEEAAAIETPADADADAEIDLVFARANEELRLKTEVYREMLGLAEAGRWDVDLDLGTLTFLNTDGTKITAPVQVVGTFNTKDSTWLWGWDHPSIPEPVREHAWLVHAFGAKYGLEALTTRMIAASEEDAWEFAALACHLAGAQGAYRGPTGTTMVFMTFGTTTLSKV